MPQTTEYNFKEALKNLNNKNLPHEYEDFEQFSSVEVLKRYKDLKYDYMNYKLPIKISDLDELVTLITNTVTNPYISLKGQDKRLVFNGYKMCEDFREHVERFNADLDEAPHIKLSLLETFISYVNEMPMGVSDSFDYMNMIVEGGFLYPLLVERGNIIMYQNLITQNYNQLDDYIQNDRFKESELDKKEEIKEHHKYVSKTMAEEKGIEYIDPELEELTTKMKPLREELSNVESSLNYIYKKKEEAKDSDELDVLGKQEKDQLDIKASKLKELKKLEKEYKVLEKKLNGIYKKMEKQFKKKN